MSVLTLIIELPLKKKDKSMNAMTALTIIKTLKKKAMPIINSYACKGCGSIATVSVSGNAIKVTKCACVKAGV